MTDKEFKNKMDGAMEKCFNAMTQHEAYTAEFSTAVDNLHTLHAILSPSGPKKWMPCPPPKEEVAEPYVDEPPFEVSEAPAEEAAPAVDYKALRTELQKKLSQARKDKGINPKDLVQKYADSFKFVADEDLPKLEADLEEAVANA